MNRLSCLTTLFCVRVICSYISIPLCNLQKLRYGTQSYLRFIGRKYWTSPLVFSLVYSTTGSPLQTYLSFIRVVSAGNLTAI